ncbi:MAG: hypothetical protein ATN36_07105 [Epulopiscium sp. Nele67-Bin005]|nr:MAG: hypothetical protein ATN36_07105 [Epulopiscium sp. Nele67-Bin005]
MAFAVIDIGSNTIKLSIYKLENNEFIKLLNAKETAGLAGYRRDGFLTWEGIEKACEVLNGFKSTLSIIKLEHLFVFSTASLRNVINSKEVVHEIEKQTGFHIDLISGEMEATLGFYGASKINDLDNGLLLDIGGGSTEIVEYVNGKIENCTSISIGSLSLYSIFVKSILPNKKEQKLISEYVKEHLDEIDFIQNKQINTILGMGGSVRTVKKMCFKKYDLKEKHLDYKYIPEMINFVRDNKKEGIDLILKVAPDRIHTAIPGIIIADEIAQLVGAKQIISSNFGLREGYVYNKIKGDFYNER